MWSLSILGNAQDNPLQRRISISFTNISLSNALQKISSQGGFLLSYNAAGINADSKISITAKNQSVRKILETILGKDYEFKSGGSHIIIIPKKQAASQPNTQGYTVTGVVRDAKTGQVISSVSIVEVGERNTTATNSQGTYQLPLKGNSEFARILISRKSYRDTVITIKPSPKSEMSIQLRPLIIVDELKPLPPDLSAELKENGLFKSVVSEEQQLLSSNLPLYEQRAFQISFLPNIGTNRNFSGLVENHFSFNMLGGYSMALSGFELAGLFNITRRNVRGAQIGGFMNITGGETTGWQLAGFMNNNMGAVNGVQTAGFYNLSMDSLSGVQASGFFNMARKSVKGVQMAGFLNISGKRLKGAQIAGFMNLSGKDVRGAQLAGFCNLSKGDFSGLQSAGFINLSTGNMRGAQISGGINVTVDTTYTIQVAGLANFARWIYGAQIGVFNLAGKVKGSQIGIFNICDTIRGVPLGLLSIVRQGLHQFEISTGDANQGLLSLRTGTHRLHNIISAGFFKIGSPSYASFGYGLGSMTSHKKHDLGIGGDVVLSLVFNESFKKNITPDIWGRLNLFMDYQPFKGLSIFAGPSLNAYRIDKTNISGPRPNYGSEYYRNYTSGATQYKIWLGWQAGIRLF